MPATRPLKERLIEKIEMKDGCWIFTGAIATSGYGRIGFRNRTLQAHRAAYEEFVGEIPDGLHIDHLCGNKRCVNPDHLEPVTQVENNVRAAVVRVANTTQCKHGHAFTPDNTFMHKRGGRQCRTCHNLRNKARRRSMTLADLAVLLGGTREEI